MRLTLFLAIVVAILCGTVRCEEPKPIEITIRARAIESPVLKYQLLPSEAELKAGNAAPILLRLPWEQTAWMNKIFPTLHEWGSRPLDAPEWTTSGGVLKENFYAEMKRAAYRRDALWEYPIGETPTPYMILLPDVQGLRIFLGHGLSARIRWHLSRGELNEAREAILVGLANSRHLAQTPFFVNQLVALAIQSSMLDRTAELISQPNSPNLYWALSTLPDSMIELDRASSLEAAVFAMTLPAVNDLERPRSAAEWKKMADQLVTLLQELGDIPPQNRAKEGASVVEQILARLNAAGKSKLELFIKDARAELPAMLKIPAEKVAAMSDDEAGVRWYVHKRIARDHQTAAVLILPPHEAWPLLKRLQGEVESMRAKTGGQNDFFDPLKIYISIWSVKRKIQSLRAIEAVRHHVAVNDGKLPASLPEIQGVPIPLDPLTGKAFQWKVDGNTATLKAPPLPADVVDPDSAQAGDTALEYRLILK